MDLIKFWALKMNYLILCDIDEKHIFIRKIRRNFTVEEIKLKILTLDRYAKAGTVLSQPKKFPVSFSKIY